jgi:preprotein translocase subunit SecE
LEANAEARKRGVVMGTEVKKMSKSIAAASPDDNFGARVASWPEKIKTFYNDVRTEMKKVTTPSFKEVQATTAVVIITVFIFAAYFAVVDYILKNSLDWLLRTMAHR